MLKKTTKLKIILNIAIIILASLPFVIASEDYFIPLYQDLPYKVQLSNASWSQEVNQNYNPIQGNWSVEDNWISPKCLSFGASSVNDWFSLNIGRPLYNYQNYINNRSEQGSNPRELEIVYYYRSNLLGIYGEYFGYYQMVPSFEEKDRVTHEKIPRNPEGYLQILTNPPANLVDYDDPNFGNSPFSYTIEPDEYLIDYSYKPIQVNSLNFKRAIDKYGIIYTQEHGVDDGTLRGSLMYKYGVHSLPIVGYRDYNNGTYHFWVHESYFGNESDLILHPVEAFEEAWVLYDQQWYTYHHDYRRTGFTILKGDIQSDDLEKGSYPLSATGSAIYDKPSIADIDGNCKLDVIVAINFGEEYGRLFRMEDTRNYQQKDGMCKLVSSSDISSMKLVWNKIPQFSGTLVGNPTLEDINGDSQKEILVAVEGGQVYALNTNGELYKGYGGVPSDAIVGNIAAYDIDLDGTKEIIFASYASPPDQAKLYILNATGNSKIFNVEQIVNIGTAGTNGRGTNAPVSIANIDDDNYPEIIVPSVHGIFVFGYDEGSGTVIEDTDLRDTYAGIPYSVVVSDVDRDNKYELVYVTNAGDYTCYDDDTCYNALRVRESESSDDDHSVLVSGYPVTTPVVADISSTYDGLEIVFAARTVAYNDPSGKIYAYRLGDSGYEKLWEYPSSGTIDLTYTGVDAADIDPTSPGIEIIYGGDAGKLYVLSNQGELLYDYSLGGTIASAPAIGDWDGDGKAEIVVKHYTTGSGQFLTLNGTPIQYPVARYEPGYEYTWNHGLMPMESYTGQIAVVSGSNRMPVLTPIENIIIIEGDYVVKCNDEIDYSEVFL